MTTVAERFEEKYIPEALSGCFLWIGAQKNSRGYGNFNFNGKIISAHRVSWMIYKGGIPDAKHVLHKCDNPNCVNPEHLFLGTHSENMNDMKQKGRQRFFVGSSHGNSKLTENQIIEMRKLGDSGVCRSDIAKMFGIGKSMANYICNREYWTHVVDKNWSVP
jgi:hypothetical protein